MKNEQNVPDFQILKNPNNCNLWLFFFSCGAIVLAPAEVPAKLNPLIAKTKSPSIFVRRLDENDIKLVAVSRIQLLGMNKVDRQRAEKTEGIQGAYNMAVAMLRGDV